MLLWGGQTVSYLGTGIAFVVLPLLVFQRTHSIVQMGLVTALTGGCSLIAGLVSGLLTLQYVCLLLIGWVHDVLPLALLNVGITFGDILVQILSATIIQARDQKQRVFEESGHCYTHKNCSIP